MIEQTVWTGRTGQESPAGSAPAAADTGFRRAMELMFFAYRDFTGEADAILADYGLGRAHHRAIYFIGANVGISVNELLEILKITKQSLNRVLGALIEDGYVVQETDEDDRRRRLMQLTDKGRALEQMLTQRQSARIAAATEGMPADVVDAFQNVLERLINEDDRHRVRPAWAADTL
ncbi:MAG: MarR family transcriptional regulator [Rhodospirillaceae bacterium]